MAKLAHRAWGGGVKAQRPDILWGGKAELLLGPAEHFPPQTASWDLCAVKPGLEDPLPYLQDKVSCAKDLSPPAPSLGRPPLSRLLDRNPPPNKGENRRALALSQDVTCFWIWCDPWPSCTSLCPHLSPWNWSPCDKVWFYAAWLLSFELPAPQGQAQPGSTQRPWGPTR